MNQYTRSCPNEEAILDFLLSLMSIEEIKEMEIHFDNCPECTQKARAFSDTLSTLELLRNKKEAQGAFKNTVWDILSLPAAGSHKNQGVTETRSLNGKFLIRLIPFMDEDKSILEVKVLDESLTGILTVENENGIILNSRIVHGVASDEVPNPVDLRNILIRIDQE